MLQKENLKFEVTLSGTHWKKIPGFSVWLDDVQMESGEVTSEPRTIKFEQGLFPGEHLIKVRLENKTITDTVLTNGVVVNDMLLNIDDISIDGISLGNLLWSAEYHLDSPQQYNNNLITHLDSCVNLGWNGTYILKFTSPFYIWLLEKL